MLASPAGPAWRQLPYCPTLFSQALPWAMLFWVFFRQHVYRPKDVYLLAGDEVVATKAGNPPMAWIGSLPVCMGVPGLAFFAFSW